MLSLLSDENFNGDIIRGLFLRQPDLDLVRVQDVGLQELDDPTILAWAADNNRIVITYDRATMPDFAYQRLQKNETMSGLFVVSDRISIRQAIDEILLLVTDTKQEEWKGCVLYLPL
jgi:predicted nuclease of predicted toxin-antitoxin system